MERIFPEIDKKLEKIFSKIQNKKRLDFKDGVALFKTNDLISLGILADLINKEKNYDYVFFVVNRQINPTNICVLSCKFCNFATKKNNPDAYEYTTDEILKMCDSEIDEVHITGAMHPYWKYEDYINIVKKIHKKYPNIHIKAYTAVEIDWFSKISKKSIEEVLYDLKNCGVVCLPGGGAEMFSDRVRKLLYPFKIGYKRWLEIHKIAHKIGLKSNVTMLYGHIETIEERVQHLLKIRDLQDETNGFLAFVPLAFQPGNKNIKTHTSSVDDLKTIAISRILLDNFKHIKSYWVTLTEDIAQISLNFGANDIDGTIGEEKIIHASFAMSPSDNHLLSLRPPIKSGTERSVAISSKNEIVSVASLPRNDIVGQPISAISHTEDFLVRLIKGSGKIPVKRDGLYNFLKIYDTVK